MGATAGVVVTGTEVLSGSVRDSNGPWLADRLFELGVELRHLTVCGDRPEDIEAQLRFLAGQGIDVIVTTGGLGPTADDRTMGVVAGFSGRPLELDEPLEKKIAEILRPLLERYGGLDPDAVLDSNRKQAMVPRGAQVLDPVGTAPGVVVPPLDSSRPTIVVLPGPPRELRELWHEASRSQGFQSAVRSRTEYERATLRLFGIPESEIAETLRVADAELEGLDALEITTCLRRGEVELVVRREPSSEAAWRRLAELVAQRHEGVLFSTDGSTVDDQVAALLAGRRIGVAESCTGGLMAGRLTERPGSSAYVAGGVVCYTNASKTGLLGVDATLIEREGAVSPEVAEAMAEGALECLGCDTALAITGVAGPGGGSAEGPVGYVCWCAKLADGSELAREARLPGGRPEVRDRSTTVGMHLLRRLLDGKHTSS